MENCTTASFFHEIESGKPFYVSGASAIFERHPELHDMIDNEHIRSIGRNIFYNKKYHGFAKYIKLTYSEPDFRTATQMFMGIPQMGSDIHSAIGINMFAFIEDMFAR